MHGSFTFFILNNVRAKQELVYRVTERLVVSDWTEAKHRLVTFFVLDVGEAQQIIDYYKLTGEFDSSHLLLRHN